MAICFAVFVEGHKFLHNFLELVLILEEIAGHLSFLSIFFYLFFHNWDIHF